MDAERIGALTAQLADISRRLAGVEKQGQRAIQRAGAVRYNPFADTGSNQSFVLAILDTRGDGFVLSSMHSRQQTRVFLKLRPWWPQAGGRPLKPQQDSQAQKKAQESQQERGDRYQNRFRFRDRSTLCVTGRAANSRAHPLLDSAGEQTSTRCHQAAPPSRRKAAFRAQRGASARTQTGSTERT